MIVRASYEALVVLVAAPAAGLLILGLRMVGRSGEVRTTLQVLRHVRSDVAALIVYDAVGGALCAGGVLILGISRPPALVTGFSTDPVLAWSIVGFFGPLVSAGILDRLPLRSLVDFLSRNDSRDEPGSTLIEVRFQASQRILFQLYEEVRVRNGIERDALSLRARELTQEGRLHFDDVAREIDVFASSWKRRVPREVKAVLARRTHWPTGEDPGREGIVLVDTAIAVGLVQPITIACRVAEHRPPVTPL